ncbi:DUF1642 domain-containing protein [Enterococcus faecium]|nr:DUF1642 domain-containing protein [Enterococcus faecium]EGP4927241.1 DUF1642 domain-containing protein [Enterococcus faecium]EGP4951713.1 DUF1642 domain-containing protein [Enterococcus faecium]EGP4991410.1 DUF1642 domain-containing protein [Enterococcus faecium]EGP5054857.1 DUF1642 domain-containing protein [Enterococcus faecium]EGP5212306.1 DUF1642 domain-containing protein [Enterococcus faecium]
MNKQELIERYKTKYAEEPKDWKHPSVNASRQDLFANFIRDLEQLDEPQKPVVPRFVAEWIEKLRKQIVPYHFESGARFMMFIGRDFHHKKGLILINEEIRQWLEKDGNEVILSDAIDYGYEVEKEPLYEVIIGDLYLIKKFNDRNDFCFDTSHSLCTWEKSAYQLTEEEIKAIDERFWAFAVPVEEVVEG